MHKRHLQLVTEGYIPLTKDEELDSILQELEEMAIAARAGKFVDRQRVQYLAARSEAIRD